MLTYIPTCTTWLTTNQWYGTATYDEGRKISIEGISLIVCSVCTWDLNLASLCLHVSMLGHQQCEYHEVIKYFLHVFDDQTYVKISWEIPWNSVVHLVLKSDEIVFRSTWYSMMGSPTKRVGSSRLHNEMLPQGELICIWYILFCNDNRTFFGLINSFLPFKFYNCGPRT